MVRQVFYTAILILFMGIITSCFILFGQDKSAPVMTREDSSYTIIPGDELIPPFVNDPYYNKVLKEAMILQNIADSLSQQAFHYRKEIMFMDDISEKSENQYQLALLEEHLQEIKFKADSLFGMLSEISGTADKRTSLLILDTIIEGIKVYHYNLEEINGGRSKEDRSGTVHKLQKENLPVTGESSHIFLISSRSPYSFDHPFEYDFQIPPGVFYRIQLAALSKEIGWNQFGGIQPITVENSDDGKIRRYFAGKFARYSDAETALGRIRSAGFKDAFIVSYYNGQRMSVEQVREFERWDH